MKVLLGVVSACAAIVAWIVFYDRACISTLREERDMLRAPARGGSRAGTGAGSGDGRNHAGATVATDELGRLREENRELRARIAEAEEDLRRSAQDKVALNERLQELLRPTREDIVSSALKTSMSTNEGLITGGYQTADGNYQFTSVEPHIDRLPDGRPGIRLQARQYSLTPEALGQMQLDSLRTSAGNTLQHGELWASEDLARLAEILGANGRGDMMTSPAITVPPGQRAEIAIGEYRMSATPKLSADGAHVEIELRVEQPREPQEPSETSGQPKR